VELRRAQDVRRDRPGGAGPLVCLLGRAVARGELVGADDRDHQDPPRAGLSAGFLQVPRRGGAEPRGRLVLRRRPGGGVDNAVHARQRIGQAVPSDHVYAAGTRDRDDIVPSLLEHLDGVTAHPSRGTRHGSLCDWPGEVHAPKTRRPGLGQGLPKVRAEG
jgi:hypothetical protein